jgi:hypothetical protein
MQGLKRKGVSTQIQLQNSPLEDLHTKVQGDSNPSKTKAANSK